MIQRTNLHAGRLAGLVSPVLVLTDLGSIKRSGLVNRFRVGTNRAGLSCFFDTILTASSMFYSLVLQTLKLICKRV